MLKLIALAIWFFLASVWRERSAGYKKQQRSAGLEQDFFRGIFVEFRHEMQLTGFSCGKKPKPSFCVCRPFSDASWTNCRGIETDIFFRLVKLTTSLNPCLSCHFFFNSAWIHIFVQILRKFSQKFFRVKFQLKNWIALLDAVHGSMFMYSDKVLTVKSCDWMRISTEEISWRASRRFGGLRSSRAAAT